jgi:hypothetical protein
MFNFSFIISSISPFLGSIAGTLLVSSEHVMISNVFVVLVSSDWYLWSVENRHLFWIR